MSKIYGYCRTAMAGNIDAQIGLISKYCKDAELKLEMCFCDDGISAYEMDRPEMGKLFNVIKRGDMIITKDFSRFTRNPIALQVLIDNMDSMGVKLVCVERNEDDSASLIRSWFEERWRRDE